MQNNQEACRMGLRRRNERDTGNWADI